MENITVHSVVKNEPFIYYSIKSVYDYVGKILLYDTGSTDKHTLSDISLLLAEDYENKITFQQVETEFDEVGWTEKTFRKMQWENKGKRGVGFVRKQQLLDTDTDFFFILDGDEVHYRETMEDVVAAFRHWKSNVICMNIPLTWFYSLDAFFRVTRSGRLFATDKIDMMMDSPGEMHICKKTKTIIRSGLSSYKPIRKIKSYAHFETMLKPWRREVSPRMIRKYKDSLPEVMIENPFFIERLENERKMVYS